MKARLTRTHGIAAAALLAAALFTPGDALAQDGRSRVLIPDLFPAEGTRDNFGKDVAKELRDLMDDQVFFVAVEKDEIEDALDDVDMDMDELDCVFARQLASRVSAGAVLCASYRDVGNDMMEFTEIVLHPIGGGEPFSLEVFSIDKDDEDEAAERIMGEFDAFVELSQYRRYCYEYSGLEQWEDALRNCSLALEATPGDMELRFQIAQIYRAQDRLEEALEEVDIVLADEMGQLNEDALNTGGWLATQLGQEEKALGYYMRYLEAVPDASAVRQRIAYEMNQAGDPQGAMQLLEEGLGPDADIGIYSYYGTFAFNSARELLLEAGIDPSDREAELPPEVAELYRTAIDALERVFEVRGDSASAGTMRNVVVARIQLGELSEAEAFGEQLTRTFPENQSVWVSYAQALQLQDKVDAALDAWSEVGRINPDYPDLYTRQANLLLAADRREDAVPLLRRAVQDGFDPNTAAQMIFNDGYQRGMQGELGRGYTIESIELAREFDTSPQTTSMLNFFQGFALYEEGRAIAGPETVETARRALPIFQRALGLVREGRQYAESTNQNLQGVVSALEQLIEIQELLIERGR